MNDPVFRRHTVLPTYISAPIASATADYADSAIAAGHGDDDYTALAGYFAFEGRPDSY